MAEMTFLFNEQGKLICEAFHALPAEQAEEEAFFDHNGKLIAVVTV